MTQKTVGGHIYGVTCSIGGGQSEHVAVYMPEATALSLFLTNEESPQVPTPAWIVGARPILDIEDATLSSNATLQPLKGVRFTSDLVDVQIVSSKFKVSGSKPIVAFSGETEDLLGMSLSPDDVHLARTNRLGKQRDTTGGPLSFNRKVVQYYRGHGNRRVNWMLWHNRYHTNKGVIDEIMDYTVKTEASALKPLFPKLDIYN
ncbi:Pentatricopeptide repeat-containing protein [Durusdinium trenchii]|uniref:Chloroplastic n=1 Tax=Durusdinium trenchii TaxID=1381693 RepID=A0ABP0Q8L9_9DINO